MHNNYDFFLLLVHSKPCHFMKHVCFVFLVNLFGLNSLTLTLTSSVNATHNSNHDSNHSCVNATLNSNHDSNHSCV